MRLMRRFKAFSGVSFLFSMSKIAFGNPVFYTGHMTYFKGRTAVLATMHGKEKVIAPILEHTLGIKVVLPKDFDSDQFGTFTRDIARTGNQLEAARRKAKTAMTMLGLDLAIASEGTFGADPQIPFIQSNLELVLLVDDKNGIEVKGHHRSSDTNMRGQYVSSVEEALEFAKSVGFPEHGVIVRKSKTGNASIYKGIKTEGELRQRVSNMLSGFFTKKIYIETDMRAHMNPTRMEKIAKATEDLVKNVTSECPECNTPGFVIVDFKRGLVCARCKLRTDSALAYIR